MLFQPHSHATSSPRSKAGPEALSIYFLFSTSNVTLFSIQTNTNINGGGTTKKKNLQLFPKKSSRFQKKYTKTTSMLESREVFNSHSLWRGNRRAKWGRRPHALHPPPPPLLVVLSTCPPLTSPGRLCLENQQEVSFAWTGGDWCCWQQAEGPPGAAAWPLSLVLTHGLALGPLDCVARALHVFFAQASRPTHYTERTWSGGMAPPCPSPRQSCSPTFLSTAPFIALAFAESHTRSAPPR